MLEAGRSAERFGDRPTIRINVPAAAAAAY
jgi:hypothetical protein